MSIIFGIKRESDESVAEAELLPLARSATNWATGVTKLRAARSLGMGFLPKNSCPHSELRPVVDAVGNVVCLDGRLDNREDLIRRLGISSVQISDEQIILASFEKWKCDSFSMFVGDWAMALWDHDAKSLFLARDHSG
jgi:asparagine synthase (glutamine-hydrolysing)